jgi:hypothetical protein
MILINGLQNCRAAEQGISGGALFSKQAGASSQQLISQQMTGTHEELSEDSRMHHMQLQHTSVLHVDGRMS